jgi:hypothetical protein
MNELTKIKNVMQKVISGKIITALLFVVTIMYVIKTHPILKILALFLNVLAIYNTYKTIINKPKS